MIDIVADKRLIAKCQKQFILRLKSICKEPILCKVGYRGNSDNVTAFYSSKYNFWSTTSKITSENNRYWNAFGIGKPTSGKSNSITVEINPPLEGINRSTGGVFGQTLREKYSFCIEAKLAVVEKVLANNYSLNKVEWNSFRQMTMELKLNFV